MKYSVTHLPDIYINRYTDTFISIPFSLQYISGEKEPVMLFLGSHPGWIKPVTVSTTMTLDEMAVFKTRFHPYNAGSYKVSFGSKGASSDTQSYSFNVNVAEAPDCAAYLVGEYYATKACRPLDPGPSYETVTRGSQKNAITIGWLQAYVNCTDRTIDIPYQPGGKSSNKGAGWFSNDTIFLHVTTHIYKIYEDDELDTCDIIMVRK